MRTKTIKQTGFVVGGVAQLKLWDGSVGYISVEDCFLPYDKATPKNILRCVNDNKFGCEYIKSAEIYIFISYDNGSVEYDRTIYVDHPIHTQHFLGWRELRKQGIKV